MNRSGVRGVLGHSAPSPGSWPALGADELDHLLGTAEALATQGWQHPTLADFHAVFATGNRAEYDQRVEADIQRLATLVLAQCVGPDQHRIDDVLEGLRGLAGREHWHLPAHERDRPSPDEQAPTTTNRSLDMCSAEIGALVAWSLALLGDDLTSRDPGLVDGLRHAVTDKVLQRYLDCDAGWLAPARPTNWNPWVNHQVLSCALLLCGEEDLGAAVRHAVAESLGHYWTAMPQDGAVEEGFSYWWQGVSHFLTARTILASGGHDVVDAADPAESAKLAALMRFPVALAVDERSCLTFSDSERWIPPDLPWQVLHEAATSLGERGLAKQAGALATRRVPLPSVTVGLELSLRSLLDPSWSTSARSADGSSPTTSSCYPSAGLHVSRVEQDGARWVLGMSLGHNGQLHNHLDVGSFALWAGGHPVVLDLGAPTYDGQTFGPHRYRQWGLASDWHATPAIDGSGQVVGAHARATDVACSAAPHGGWRHTARLEAAYPASRCATWTRTLELAPAAEVLTVTDHGSWTETGGTALVALVLPGSAQRVEGGVVVQAGDREVHLAVDGAADLLLEHRQVDDPRLREAWGPTVARLLVAAPPVAASLEGSLTTTFTSRRRSTSA